jgi:hypothetical protein
VEATLPPNIKEEDKDDPFPFGGKQEVFNNVVMKCFGVQTEGRLYEFSVIAFR